MIANLNKDKNMKAQQKRAAAFLEKNWKNLKGILNQVAIWVNLNRCKVWYALDEVAPLRTSSSSAWTTPISCSLRAGESQRIWKDYWARSNRNWRRRNLRRYLYHLSDQWYIWLIKNFNHEMDIHYRSVTCSGPRTRLLCTIWTVPTTHGRTRCWPRLATLLCKLFKAIKFRIQWKYRKKMAPFGESIDLVRFSDSGRC